MVAQQETLHPLLENYSNNNNEPTVRAPTSSSPFSSPIVAPNPPKTSTQKTMRKTFKGTAHLANLLPTGTVLTFQMFSPVFTHQGKCSTSANHMITILLLIFCSISSFLLCLTDSFRDERGKVRYGLATFKGLFVLDGSNHFISAELAAKYKLTFIDFFHAFMSVLVFGAVALFDHNIVSCFYPKLTEEGKQVLFVIPVGVGIVCSILFVLFPSKRHGIGFPLSRS
ncbi:protein DMP7-like [Argentina anserina]|uniref:protein DMP7-like n=1 Tax=Argentina anserina TaxID=57926 RepID=UPI0021766872|nr:protein DMP7-like [Potentilla anserina]